MTERRRYIALAKSFEATSAKIARCVRDEINALIQRGVTVSDSIHTIADSLDQIPPLLAQMIRNAERGDELDFGALQRSQDHYFANVERLLSGINASLRIN